MESYYYSADQASFQNIEEDTIVGRLTRKHQFDVDPRTKESWITTIRVLKAALRDKKIYTIALEYIIPRMGKRVDAVLLHNDIVFVIEFKTGEETYTKTAIEQALDYAVDLKNFHQESHNKTIVPILVATNADESNCKLIKHADDVFDTIEANSTNLANKIEWATSLISPKSPISPQNWLDSVYKPTPTIIQAAQAMYEGHDVREISRSDSGAINLSRTTESVSNIIQSSKMQHRKSICFVTGVPGAGKTLAGLNVANRRKDSATGEHAVFLSGNGPLVSVLQEALARHEVASKRSSNDPITRKNALRQTKAFIQNIHHFRDNAIIDKTPPSERIAIFDEAQRAWTLEQTKAFMTQKKGIHNFNKSEPEFLISVLDRHDDWAVIVCLIGGGQEINQGEAGLREWFKAVKAAYPEWHVYISNQLSEIDYSEGLEIFNTLDDSRKNIDKDLHLAASLRSFRSEKVSELIGLTLNNEREKVAEILSEVLPTYPIAITRDINKAKNWLRKKSRGSESCGVVASSGAHRLRPFGINVKIKIDPRIWFLNKSDDVRSSGFLEDVATEFDIQGLELDWVCVAWDANLRRQDNDWSFNSFKGTKWQNINNHDKQRYLLNAYRVLLTRARQGMVIFIPHGDQHDATRQREFYDPIFDYLVSIGIPVLDSSTCENAIGNQ